MQVTAKNRQRKHLHFITGGLTLEITLFSCRTFGHRLTPRAIFETFSPKKIMLLNLRKRRSIISQIGKNIFLRAMLIINQLFRAMLALHYKHSILPKLLEFWGPDVKDRCFTNVSSVANRS